MENFQIHNLFSTPIYIIDFNEKDKHIINSEIKKYINDFEFIPTVVGGKNVDHIYVTKRTTELLIDTYNLKILRGKIFEQIDNYLINIIGKSRSELKLKVSRMYSWMTKSDSHDYFNVHHHSHLGISGVYYYDVESEIDSIYFMSDDKCPEVSPIYKFQRKDVYEVPVKNGRMILFPGWLNHGTNPKNCSNNPRMSLGFDVILREEDIC